MNLKMKKGNFIILIKALLLLLLSVKCVNSLSILVNPQSEGLYNINDDVVILNNHNFEKNVYNSPSSWLIEFYNHWCGHCIRFAPLWKSFAKSIRHWTGVRVGVVDCAIDANIPICRNHEIRSYPTLKFFSVNSKPGYLGSILDLGHDVASMQKKLYDKLKTEMREGRWPTILYRASDNQNDEISKISEKRETPDNKSGDVVFQLDLEKTLKYSLDHEISLTKTIDGEKMEALKNYIDIIVSYFPMQSNGSVYLLGLKGEIQNKKSITGEEFQKISSNIKKSLSSIYSGSDDNWIGCRGSSDIYRGYPCGMWTMFHLLTVNFEDVYRKKQDPAKVLKAIHGYVKHFFGCAECSRHFVKMAEKNISQVKNANDSILWLWRAHNEVNQRLAGDASEDPEHKKIQYPAEDDCPSCRDENHDWIESNVLTYLKKKYSSKNVNFLGSSLQTKKLYYHSRPRTSHLYMFYF